MQKGGKDLGKVGKGSAKGSKGGKAFKTMKGKGKGWFAGSIGVQSSVQYIE